jgi:hypothetical protein
MGGHLTGRGRWPDLQNGPRFLDRSPDHRL